MYFYKLPCFGKPETEGKYPRKPRRTYRPKICTENRARKTHTEIDKRVEAIKIEEAQRGGQHGTIQEGRGRGYKE